MIPERAARVAGFGQGGHDLRRVAVEQMQRAALRSDIACERLKRVVQPPASRAAERTRRASALVEHEDREDGPLGCHGRVQRGIVGKPQILAEPDDDRSLLR